MINTTLTGGSQLALGLLLFFLAVYILGVLRDLARCRLSRWIRSEAASEFHSQRWYEQQRQKAEVRS